MGKKKTATSSDELKKLSRKRFPARAKRKAKKEGSKSLQPGISVEGCEKKNPECTRSYSKVERKKYDYNCMAWDS